jgi:hypothetical protein
MSDRIDIEREVWFAGADFSLVFTPSDASNPSGWALELIVRDRQPDGGGTERLKKTTAGGAITTTLTTITVAIAAADTATLPEKLYEITLWRTDNGSKRPLADGTAWLTHPATA